MIGREGVKGGVGDVPPPGPNQVEVEPPSHTFSDQLTQVETGQIMSKNEPIAVTYNYKFI